MHINAAFDEPLVDDSITKELLRSWPVGQRAAMDRGCPPRRRMVSKSTKPGSLMKRPVSLHRFDRRHHDDDDVVDLVDELSHALGWPVISEPSGRSNGANLGRARTVGVRRPDVPSRHAPDIVDGGAGLCGRSPA